jgi:hypothetical protein
VKLPVLLAGAAALAAVLLAEATARGGIVVLEGGETIVGKIDPRRDVTLEEVVVRDPEGAEGTIRVPRHRIRWFDAAASAPTRDYWLRFLADPIEPRWDAARARHLQAEKERVTPETWEGEGGIPRNPLGPRLQTEHFDLFGPLGWFASTAEGVTMIVGPAGPSGFKPRIHVFASPTPPSETPAEPLAWIERELHELSAEAEFSIEELNRPRAVAGGADHELVTRTDVAAGPGRAPRTVRALRRVSIRADWTVVAAGYADARDWETIEPALRRAFATLRVR